MLINSAQQVKRAEKNGRDENYPNLWTTASGCTSCIKSINRYTLTLQPSYKQWNQCYFGTPSTDNCYWANIDAPTGDNTCTDDQIGLMRMVIHVMIILSQIVLIMVVLHQYILVHQLEMVVVNVLVVIIIMMKLILFYIQLMVI